MRIWFITGASRGFGARIAREALSIGDGVVATARDPSAVVKTLGEHANLLAVALDVTQDGTIANAVAAALSRFGRIDVLVNNAGFGLLGAVEEASREEIERLYGTNVFGLLAVTRAVLPSMRARRSGHVINISSIGGYRGSAGFGMYSSTKFAVEGLSEALWAELAPIGIKVTVVEPGYFRTDFLDASSLAVSATRIKDYEGTAGAARERAARGNHAQPGDPDKLAKAFLRLVDTPAAPLRMPFGSDTVAAIEAKNAPVAAELTKWRDLSVSTDFEAGPA
jgi:NAD(P)-dependent dehydrogenase (short-subunit alcohol dehydrogenase family)